MGISEWRSQSLRSLTPKAKYRIVRRARVLTPASSLRITWRMMWTSARSTLFSLSSRESSKSSSILAKEVKYQFQYTPNNAIAGQFLTSHIRVIYRVSPRIKRKSKLAGLTWGSLILSIKALTTTSHLRSRRYLRISQHTLPIPSRKER